MAANHRLTVATFAARPVMNLEDFHAAAEAPIAGLPIAALRNGMVARSSNATHDPDQLATVDLDSAVIVGDLNSATGSFILRFIERS